MLRGCWRVALAIALIVGLSGGQAFAQAAGQNADAPFASVPATTVSPPVGTNSSGSIREAVDRIANAMEAANESRDASFEDRVASEDLQAQQEMAVWAKWMFLATTVGVLVGALSVVLIWQTVGHTREGAEAANAAVVEARDATKAAYAAVHETRRIGEAQARAYVDVLASEVLSKSDTGQKIVTSCRVMLKNHGQTPAYNLRCWIMGNVRPLPNSLPFEKGDPHLFGNLGPGVPCNLTVDVAYPRNLEDEVAASRMGIFVWGEASYLDAFGNSRTVEFECFSAGGSFATNHFRPHKPTLAT